MLSNKKTILVVVWLALLGVLYVAITKLNTNPSLPRPVPRPQFSVAELQRRWPEIAANTVAPPRGNPRARYTLVEFGDFQCPQCGKARPILEALLKRYPKQVNLFFFHRPFPKLHEWAMDSAAASQAAAAQGKFWPMYDILYSHQDDLGPSNYIGYATTAGLDINAFRAALNSHDTQKKIKNAAQVADSLKIVQTPTLLVRDNTTGKTAVYIGMDSNAPGATPGFLGVKQLAAAPPWGTAPKTAKK